MGSASSDENYFSVCTAILCPGCQPIQGQGTGTWPQPHGVTEKRMNVAEAGALDLAAPALVRPKTLDPCRHAAPKLGSTFTDTGEGGRR